MSDNKQPCVGDTRCHRVVQLNDWPEDFKHENGNYYNTCVVCKTVFTGYKRRAVCRVCAKSEPTFTTKETHRDN